MENKDYNRESEEYKNKENLRYNPKDYTGFLSELRFIGQAMIIGLENCKRFFKNGRFEEQYLENYFNGWKDSILKLRTNSINIETLTVVQKSSIESLFEIADYFDADPDRLNITLEKIAVSIDQVLLQQEHYSGPLIRSLKNKDGRYIS